MIGDIKTLTDKGYGFIVCKELGKDLFFHRNSCGDNVYENLAIGTNVSFDSEETPKGISAINVQLV